MATFTALAATDVNSDILFPGLRGGDYDIITQTADTFAIKYLEFGDGLPGGNKTVTFHGSSFAYDAENFPVGGAVDSITLASSIFDLARWNFDTPVGSLADYFQTGLTTEIRNDLDRFNGGSGDDRLNGHGNQDEFYAGGGNDTVVLGFHSDGSTVNGGSGYDTIEAQGSFGLNLAKVTSVEALSFNTLFGASIKFAVGDNGYHPLPSDFHVTGDGHANSIEFSPIYADYPVALNLSHFSFANWNSAADNVTINGAAVADVLIGSRVADNINGEAGNDILRGGLGGDHVSGGAGKDTIRGDLGRDILTGGADRDFFDFNAIKESLKGSNRDVILDFQRGLDDIDLRTIDAKTGVGGNQKFEFIGKQGFHDQKGELRYKDLGSKVVVQGDVNGDGKADFEIFVKVGALSAGDFLL